MKNIDTYSKFITEQNKQLIVRGHLNEAQEHYTHEIDVHPYGWNSSPSRKEHEAGADEVVKKFKKMGFHAKVNNYHGPSGGAASIHLGHPKGSAHVDKWIRRNYDPDHAVGDKTYNI